MGIAHASLHIESAPESADPPVTPPLAETAGGAYSGTTFEWNSDGVPVEQTQTRLTLCFWNEAAAADEAAARSAEDTARAGRATRWLSLSLTPYRQTGKVNWLEGPSRPLFDAMAPAPSAGPVVILTTFGRMKSLEAMRDFLLAMSRVVTSMRDAGGLMLAQKSLALTSPADAVNLSVWESEQAALDWAYKTPAHTDALRHQRREQMADRTSFSRFMIDTAHGQWDGLPERLTAVQTNPLRRSA